MKNPPSLSLSGLEIPSIRAKREPFRKGTASAVPKEQPRTKTRGHPCKQEANIQPRALTTAPRLAKSAVKPKIFQPTHSKANRVGTIFPQTH